MLKIPDISIDRLPDQFTGLKNSSNISDFIIYKYPNIIYAEVKCCHGNTFNFANLRQYSKLIEKDGIKGVYPYVFIWFVDHAKVIAFPITSVRDMMKAGLKSINIKTYRDYPYIDIVAEKKRILVSCDFTNFFDVLNKEGENNV